MGTKVLFAIIMLGALMAIGSIVSETVYNAKMNPTQQQRQQKEITTSISLNTGFIIIILGWVGIILHND